MRNEMYGRCQDCGKLLVDAANPEKEINRCCVHNLIMSLIMNNENSNISHRLNLLAQDVDLILNNMLYK